MRVRLGIVGVLAGMTAALLQTPTAVAVEPTDPPPASTGITMVQANIKEGMALARTRADVATVTGVQPDFITYNEVSFRDDALLAPEGYALYRETRNRYTASSPLAWRTDRWTAVATGTFRISNYQHVPNGRKTKLGLRFANWATLQGVDGRVVSVVSVHFSPRFRHAGREHDMIPHSARRLSVLVDQLAASGPVLVGGDLNVPIHGARYPRATFDAVGLRATYDLLGTSFPTHTTNAAIDYVLVRGEDQVEVAHHAPLPLNSDHHAVVAGLTWTVDAPIQVQVVRNDPAGDQRTQRAVLRTVARNITQAPPGSVVEVGTVRLAERVVLRRLRAAVNRGVKVRVTVRGKNRNVLERRLRRVIRTSERPGNAFRVCKKACVGKWRANGMPNGLVVVTPPDRTDGVRLDVSRRLGPALVQRRSRVTVRTGPQSLDEGVRLLRVVR